jgi:hypothetical protein
MASVPSFRKMTKSSNSGTRAGVLGASGVGASGVGAVVSGGIVSERFKEMEAG